MSGVPNRIHIIALVMVVSGLADLITFTIPKSGYIPLVFNLQDLVQFSLLAIFYNTLSANKKVISWGVTTYITLFIAVTLWSQSIFVFQTLMWTISGVIQIAFGVDFLIYVFVSRSEMDGGTMWINSGLLFYFCFSLFLFVMGDYILNELPYKTKMVYWSCHNVNNILKNVFIGIGIVYSKKALK